MGRNSELSYSTTRNHFYSTIGGKKYYFGSNEQRAKLKFYEMLAKHERGEAIGVNPLVADIVYKFLNYKKAMCKETSYVWYSYPLIKFLQYVGPKKRAVKVTRDVVDVWIKTEWTKTYRGKKRSDAGLKQPLRAVKSCYKFAFENNLIAINPLAGLEIGQTVGADISPTDEQLKQLLNHFRNDTDLIDLLQFQAVTGARVYEARNIDCSFVNLEKGVITLTPELTKQYDRMKVKEVRTIYLNEHAKEIVRRNLEKNKSGYLFQNPNSRNSENKWETPAISQRFKRAEETLGFRITQKSLRHKWSTDFIMANGNIAAGSRLLGHTSTKMMMDNYQKVKKNIPFIMEQSNIVKPVAF